MHSYRVSGLNVSSEIRLPGLIATPDSAPIFDVVIRMGMVPRELMQPSEVRPTYQIAGDCLLLRIPHVARFLLCAGGEMTIQPEDAAPLADIAIFVTGTAFGILLHQRQQVVLHASAISVGGRAVLFCGPSGAGKSTMAAALGKLGYATLSDDLCAITLDRMGLPTMQADGRQLKLWAEAIEKLGLAESRRGAVRNNLEKFFVDPGSAVSGPVPIGAVYVQRKTRPPVVEGIERPNVVDAARAVYNNAYRPRLVHALQQTEHYLRAGAAIVSAAGVYRLNRPFDFAAIPRTIDRLERHWRTLGLLGATI